MNSAGSAGKQQGAADGSSGDQKGYQIKVIQHPDRARTCGFGEKDKRPIDPTPVVQLIPPHPVDNFEEEFLACQHFVVFCEVYRVKDGVADHPPEDKPYPMVSQPSGEGPVSILVGTNIAHAHHFKGSDTVPEAILFVFPELSIRIEGTFRLQFCLFPGIGSSQTIESSSVIYTDFFKTYPPKHFPGMTASSDLSIALSKQGFRVNVRNSSDPTNQLETSITSDH